MPCVIAFGALCSETRCRTQVSKETHVWHHCPPPPLLSAYFTHTSVSVSIARQRPSPLCCTGHRFSTSPLQSAFCTRSLRRPCHASPGLPFAVRECHCGGARGWAGGVGGSGAVALRHCHSAFRPGKGQCPRAVALLGTAGPPSMWERGTSAVDQALFIRN